MLTEGVDYAFSRPDPAGLYKAGKRFVCRYGGPGTSDKHLTATEARALAAAGLAVVANAEGAAEGLLGGWTTGQRWAASADAHFRACGMPPDRPIYLSVDFPVTAAGWPVVADALHGAASVLGANRVGVYGSYNVMLWALRDNLAPWRWQTYAWSGGRWAPDCHIQQYQNGVNLAGGALDLDRAMTADYGQWGLGTPTQTAGGDKMFTLIRYEHDAAVFLTDSVVARWVTTPGEIADLGTLNATGRLNIPAGTDIQIVGRRELVGVIVGPCPPGWEDRALLVEPPVVALTDEQLAEIAAAVVARVDTPLGEADRPAIEAALRTVLRSV